MKMKYILAFVLSGLCASLAAQIKIGDNPQNIDPASVLELESSNRVLVITRISTAEMNAINPLPGALIYNTDDQCMYYFNSIEWLNLCNLGLQLTADAIVNTFPTIVLTENGNATNIEVGEIRGANIVDFSISAVDIQNNSITSDKLAPNSVGVEELQDNTVADAEIDYNQVTISDFINDVPYITSAQIISTAPGNDLIDNGGAFYDDAPLQNGIATNAAAIAADGDTDATNELQDLTISAFTLGITGGNTVDLGVFYQSAGDVQFNPYLTITSNNVQAAIQELKDEVDVVSGGGSDDQLLTLSGNTLSIEDGNSVDLSAFDDPGTDDQNLSLTGNVINIESGNSIDLTPILGSGGTDDQNLTGATLDASNILTIDIEDGTSASVDLSSLAGGGGTDDQNLTLAGNTLSIEDGNSVDLSPFDDPGTDDQEAFEVPFTPTGNTVSADVQAAIEELQTEIDGISSGAGNPTDELITSFTLNGTSLEIVENANVVPPLDLDPVFATDAELAALPVDDADAVIGNEYNTAFQVNAGNLEITDGGGTLSVALTDIDTDDQTAAEVNYDNTTSGLIATDTQAAIDEIAAAGSTDDQEAFEVPYDNTASGLAAINTQAAIDEIVSTSTDDQEAFEVSYDNTTSGLVATDTQAAIDEIAAAGSTDDQEAFEVPYDNTISGLTAIDTQAAIDEIVAANTDDQEAFEVPYDNTTSGLVATDTQAAIDEIAAAGSTDDQEAFEVPYDNTTSGLAAIDTQAAIDEIVATSVAPHTGGPGAVYYADATGAPITNDDSFVWDDTARVGTGALYIGLDAGTGVIESNVSKVQIAEQVPTEVAYPLHIQNRDGNANPANDDRGSAVGLLLAVDALEGFGKGAIAYQRRSSWARGDFHVLQNTTADNSVPTLADAVLTVTNAGNVGIGTNTPNEQLHVTQNFELGGDLIAQNGAGTLGQVLTTTAAGTEWAAPAGGFAGTPGSVFFADDPSGSPTENNSQLFWDNTELKLYVGNPVATAGDVKLNVDGTTRTQGIKNSDGTAGTPAYRFTNDISTGMYLPAIGEIGFSTNNTEAIRIDGAQNVGIGTATPNSTLVTNGSFATNIRTVPAGAVLGNDHTVIFNTSGAITLPIASACTGRIYILKNTAAASTIDTYVDNTGASSTSFPTGTLWLQSDGTDWHQVN